VLRFAGDSTATGTIGDGTHQLGKLIVAGGTGKTVTVTGTGDIALVKVAGAGTLQFSDTINSGSGIGGVAIAYSADGTVKFNKASGGNLISTITNTSGAAAGTVLFANTSGTNSVTGDIGATGTGALAHVTLSGAGGTTSAAGSVYAPVNFTGDATFQMTGANKTLSGAVTTGTGGTGTVEFNGGAGTSTVTSDMGVSGTALKKVLISGATTVSTAGNVYAPVSITNDGGLTVAADKVVSGAITNDQLAASKGTVIFSGATTLSSDIGTSVASHDLKAVTFGGTTSLGNNVYAKTVSLGGGSGVTYTMTGSKTIGSAVAAGSTSLAAATTLDLGAYTLTQGGTSGSSFSAADTSAIKLTVGSSQATTGQIVLGGGTSKFANGGTITVTPTISGTVIHSGDKVALVSGGGAAPTVGTINVTGSGLISWTAAQGAVGTDRFSGNTTVNDVVLTATVANASTALSGISTGGGAAVNVLTAYTGSNAKLVGLSNALMNASTVDAKKGGEQLKADSTGASITAATGATSASLATVTGRSSQTLLASTNGTGISSGEALKGMGFWAQGFGSSGSQGTISGQAGYDAATGGVALGADAKVSDSVRVGIAGSWATTQVDNKVGAGGISGNGTSIDSYQGTLYATYMGKPWYVNGAFSGTVHNYDTTRKVAFGAFTDTVKGSHDGTQYTVKVDGGYPVAVGKAVVTPFAGVTYSNLNQDAYTETSANGAGLTINSVSFDSYKSQLGAKVSTTLEAYGRNFVPELRASWVHEFNNKAVDTTAAFAAGGSTFVTPGVKPGAEAAVIGVGATIVGKSNIALTANYDAELRDSFVGHTGSLQLRADF
jgi:outer membrane autotransporter protein